MKKILFVNDEMVMGGVARILNTLLKNIDREQYQVDLLVLHKHGALLEEIPEGIRVLEGSSFFNTIDVPLKQCTWRNVFNKLRLLAYMKTGFIDGKIKKERKKILKETYDVEFSAKEGFCTIFVASGDSAKKLNWVQVDYKEKNYSVHHMNLVKKQLQGIDMNIACSQNVKASYQELFDVKRIVVVHNLIDIDKIIHLSEQLLEIEATEKIRLICVARFHEQKGLDRLIKAYAKVKDSYELMIIGDGELKDSLYDLAKSLDVFEQIHWLGMQSNPYHYIKACDLFVLPSLYEGYATITLESLISGTPILALEVAGIHEQITQPEYGWVVDNNEQALVDKLIELKDSKPLLTTYKQSLMTYRYDNASIMKKYDELFK